MRARQGIFISGVNYGNTKQTAKEVYFDFYFSNDESSTAMPYPVEPYITENGEAAVRWNPDYLPSLRWELKEKETAEMVSQRIQEFQRVVLSVADFIIKEQHTPTMQQRFVEFLKRKRRSVKSNKLIVAVDMLKRTFRRGKPVKEPWRKSYIEILQSLENERTSKQAFYDASKNMNGSIFMKSST